VSQEDQEFGRGVMSVAWSPDGVQFVAGVRDGTVRLYGLESGNSDQPVIKEMEQLKVEGQGGVRTVAFSGDGRMLASAGHDGIVRVWATDNKRSLIREFKGWTLEGKQSLKEVEYGRRYQDLKEIAPPKPLSLSGHYRVLVSDKPRIEPLGYAGAEFQFNTSGVVEMTGGMQLRIFNKRS
jgi:WD40 repeat protein